MDGSLIERTLTTFGPLAERPLSGEDAESIIANLTGLFELLEAWAVKDACKSPSREGCHES